VEHYPEVTYPRHVEQRQSTRFCSRERHAWRSETATPYGDSIAELHRSDSACSSPSVTTMYVTVPATPITETVYAASVGSPSVEGGARAAVASTLTITNSITETVYVPSPGISSIEGGADTAIVPTLTVTSSITETVYVARPGTTSIEVGVDTAVTNSVASTNVIQLIKATSQPDPYSFTEDNGTTSWMGGRTPPASASLVTSTSFITLQPDSSPVSEDASAGKTTSCVTISSTRTVTHTHTGTLIESLSVVPASTTAYTGHCYTGFGSAGWNATSTTFLSLKVVSTGSGRAIYGPGTSEDSWSRQGGLYGSPISSVNSPRPIKPRRVENIVFATIDNVAVSWTNNYDGSPKTTPEAGPTFVPVTATAPPFGGKLGHQALEIGQLTFLEEKSSASSNPSQISSNPAAPPTTTVGIYPWKLGPASSVLTIAASISLQPGIVPMPSISTSDIASVLSAVFTAQPVSLTTSTKVFSTKSSSTTTTSNTAASSANSSCSNDPAQFTVDFDDLPSFSTGPGDTDIPPIFNPYRKLYWEGHYGYVPPPTDPFPPHSPPQLAVYRGHGLSLNSSIGAGRKLTGGLGSGPRAVYSAYWFDALSAWLGKCFPEVTGPNFLENVSLRKTSSEYRTSIF